MSSQGHREIPCAIPLWTKEMNIISWDPMEERIVVKNDGNSGPSPSLRFEQDCAVCM